MKFLNAFPGGFHLVVQFLQQGKNRVTDILRIHDFCTLNVAISNVAAR
jgi:hypothetical protein